MRSICAERWKERVRVLHVETNELHNQMSSRSRSGQVVWADSWISLTLSWVCLTLKSETTTWSECGDWNWFIPCEIFRAGMENKQIFNGLSQDNEIIQVENGRGQFSYNHVLCLTFSSSHFVSPPLCYMHTCPSPFTARRYYFPWIPDVVM